MGGNAFLVLATELVEPGGGVRVHGPLHADRAGGRLMPSVHDVSRSGGYPVRSARVVTR